MNRMELAHAALGDDLARFQNEFLHALYHPTDASVRMQPLSEQAGFTVYRNTVLKGCVDALEANFPTVTRLVGQDWLRAAALSYARATPPDSVMLMEYGADFPDFLAHFPPARELPYLAGIARLDRMWTEAHMAADVAPLDAQTLALLAPEVLGEFTVHPHPATRWTWFPEQPIYAIWRTNREEMALDDELPWIGDGALLTRLDGAVRWCAGGPGLCAFLDACADKLPLAAAAQAAQQVQPGIDIARLLADLISAGALVAPDKASLDS